MKLLAIVCCLLSLPVIAATEFGKKVDTSSLTPISELLSNVDKFDGKEVTIKGMITNVCSMRGCWMEFASDKEYQTLRIKVQDGDMVFPISSKGKTAFATGKLNHQTFSKDQLVSMATERAKKMNQEPDLSKITGPQTFYQFVPVGVKID